jgi:predicted nucleotidyltransferase
MVPDHELERLVANIVRGYDPEAIGLFGSHATGFSKPGSDWAGVVIKRTREPYEHRVMRVRRLITGTLRRIDVVVLTPEELERARTEELTFRRTVSDQMKVIYTRGWGA